MQRHFAAYRAVHEQGFLPIFVQDHFNPRVLIEACVEAGMKAIEYTLRRTDAAEMIPWVRKNFPDIYVLAGSTIDDEAIVRKMRRKFPQLRTVAELDQMGVDGFVSMINWTEDSIRAYSPRRIVIPTASTVGEAFCQIRAGAHFAKMNGSDLDLVKRCRGAAAFDYCPIMLTGGMTLERIPLGVEAGAVQFASGFDLTLKGQPPDVPKATVVSVLKDYLHVTSEARARKWPALAATAKADRQAWLDSLPHYHPF